jgi:hypothetical protein
MDRRMLCALFSLALLISLAVVQTHPDVGRIIFSELKAADLTAFKPLEELGREIKKEIGVPNASKASQCKLIALGSKPCGGPWSYEVYSTETANESRLKRLVTRYNELEQKLNAEQKILSNCEFVQQPEVTFSQGMCSIKGGK